MGGKLNLTWDAALARTRLANLGIAPNLPVGKLSGGQRALVALALALAKRPRLLLLDEPIAALDPLARHAFMQPLMGAVAETDTTVLLSSHLLADLERASSAPPPRRTAHPRSRTRPPRRTSSRCWFWSYRFSVGPSSAHRWSPVNGNTAPTASSGPRL
jgi:hypothetical protein